MGFARRNIATLCPISFYHLLTFRLHFISTELRPSYPRVEGKISKDKLNEKVKTIIFSDFITTDILPPSVRTDRALRDQLEGLLGGGTEPVAHVLRIITYHLCQNPTMLQKLRAELTSIQPSRNGIPHLDQLEKLTYLNALMKEGLRLSSGVAFRMPRIGPRSTGIREIPPGTSVSMTHPFIYHDEKIFPDSYSFSPERFLDPLETKGPERYLAQFGRGTRSCLGQQWVDFYLSLLGLDRLSDVLTNAFRTTQSCVRGIIPHDRDDLFPLRFSAARH